MVAYKIIADEINEPVKNHIIIKLQVFDPVLSANQMQKFYLVSF